MTEHTPGPWHFGKYADRVTPCEDGDGSDSICHVYDTDRWHNIRLIAAAPELLECLEQLVGVCRDAGWHKQVYSEATDAISKAKGTTNEA